MNGVPYDVAFSLDSFDLTTYTITVGELLGDEWDFSSWRWKDRK